MSILAHHVMLRLDDGRVLAPSVEARRALAAVVMDRGATGGVLAFRGSDTHLHVLVGAGPEALGRWTHALACTLHWGLGLKVPFAPARVVPVRDQGHLEVVFRYILRQDAHPRFASDPCHDASALPDLLGLRARWPDLADRVRERLPRWDTPRLFPMLGVDALERTPEPGVWRDAAAAAAALPRLDVRGTWGRAARRALLEATKGTLDGAGLRALLRTSRSSLLRLRAEPVDPVLVRAVKLQARFRTTLAHRSAAQEAAGA